MAGKTLIFTDYPSENSSEEASTEETHEKECVINIFRDFFKVNRKYGQLLNTDQNLLSTDQSRNMTLKTKGEWTNEIAWPTKFSPDANSSYFTSREQQVINSVNTNFNPLYEVNNFFSRFENEEEIHSRIPPLMNQ